MVNTFFYAALEVNSSGRASGIDISTLIQLQKRSTQHQAKLRSGMVLRAMKRYHSLKNDNQQQGLSHTCLFRMDAVYMKQHKRVGGSLEQALENKSSFNPVEVLKEGFQLTKTTIPSLLGAALLALAIFTVILMVTIQVFLGGAFDVESPPTVMTMLLIQIMVMPPLFAAIHVMGMRHAIGEKTQVSDVFSRIKQPFPYILIALITQILTQLAAGILPGILALLALGFISITLSMAIPLAAEYKLSPLQAIRSSFIAVIKRFSAFFSVYLALFGLFVLGLFTFGLALIFVVPFFYNVKGIMYREVFGVGVPDDGGSFDAEKDRDSTYVTPRRDSADKVENDTWNA